MPPCSSPSRSAGGRRWARFARTANAGAAATRQGLLGAEADPRGSGFGLSPTGRAWLRIDLADRLASHAHKARAAGAKDPVDAELARSVGLNEDGIARLMTKIGFARAGEAWRWRGRRAKRADAAGQRPGNAFAALADLKR